MIILHNVHDKASREWLAANATPDDTILDWYNPAELQRWLDAGGTLQVSAFPSVIVDVGERDVFGRITSALPGHDAAHVAIRTPATVQEAKEMAFTLEEQRNERTAMVQARLNELGGKIAVLLWDKLVNGIEPDTYEQEAINAEISKIKNMTGGTP